VERKKRSDAGRTMTTEQRKAFSDKLKRARLDKGGIEDERSENIPTGVCVEIKTPSLPSPALEVIGKVATINEEGDETIVAISSSIEGSRINSESVSI